MRFPLGLCALAGVLFALATVATPFSTAAKESAPAAPNEFAPAGANESAAATVNESAPAAEPAVEKGLMDEILQGFYWRLNVLSYGTYQNLQHNPPLNPDNVLRIPTYQAAINPRLDLDLNVRQFELGVKPRFLYLWQRWEEGLPANQQDSRTEFYVNEWIARYRPIDELSLSYGRENLQWGPSKILSSSNPFNQNNGQNNPWLEVPGLDYARAVWIPNTTWTSSFIANTAKGRLGEPLGFEINANEPSVNFKKSYALKGDWTGDGKYVSVIPSYREDTGYRVGFFGGWNVTDAVLLYTEGADGNYNGLQLQVGGSYTFEGGMTVNLEYYHNGDGCVSKNIDRCFRDGDASFSDPLVRGDYMLLQYSDHDIWDYLSVDIRLLNNFNDQSTQLTGIFEYEVGAHTQLYLVGTGYMGSRDSEFGSLLKYSLFGGVAYTF
jgi:hypothetical protein